MILSGRKSTKRSKIAAKGWCQYLDIFSDIAHHHVTRVSRSSDSSSKCYFALRFSMFRLNIAHNPPPNLRLCQNIICRVLCFIPEQSRYPIRDSVQIQASGNSCRTLLTGATASGVPASGLPAVAVGEGSRPSACPRAVKPESSASASPNTPQRTKPQVGQLT